MNDKVPSDKSNQICLENCRCLKTGRRGSEKHREGGFYPEDNRVLNSYIKLPPLELQQQQFHRAQTIRQYRNILSLRCYCAGHCSISLLLELHQSTETGESNAILIAKSNKS